MFNRDTTHLMYPDLDDIAIGIVKKASDAARQYLKSGDSETVSSDFAEACDYLIDNEYIYKVLALLLTAQPKESEKAAWAALTNQERLERLDSERESVSYSESQDSKWREE